jgi:N-acyl-D-amino-acid deacylase
MNVLIKNGRVVDGTGNPWFYSDIEIENGKIKRMARKLKVKADRTIDAEGLVVAPGFIDVHDHPEGYILFHPEMEPYVFQGITTETLGHCGISIFPDKETYLGTLASSPWRSLWWVDEVAESAYNWHSLTEYRQLVRKLGIPINVAPFMGQGTIRWKAGLRIVKPTEDRKPTRKEMEGMKQLVRRGMEEGAFGLSISLDYPPGRYTKEEEMVEILKVVAENNGVFAIHAKDCSTPEGVREAIEVARKAGVRIHVAHIGGYAPMLTGTTYTLPESLGLLDRARGEGMEITCDVQVCSDFGTSVDAVKGILFFICTVWSPQPLKGTETFEMFLENLKNPNFREEVKRTVLKYVGDPCRYLKPFFEEHLDVCTLIKTGSKELEGKTLAKIAKENGVDIIDLYFSIVFGISPIIGESVKPTIIMNFESSEVTKKACSHWLSTPCMDHTPRQSPEDAPWLGSYIAMPKFYKNVVDYGLRMEEAIRKMTSLPAQVLGLYDRGILRPGMRADIVIFDPSEYRGAADYYNPNANAAGVSYVMVKGKLVLDNGELTGERPGEILSKGAS